MREPTRLASKGVRRGALLLALALTAGCRRAPPRPQAQPRAAAPVEVRTWGDLGAIMHEGKMDPLVTVARLVGPHVYAVGALAGLRGDVTILDGTPWISYPAEPWTIRVEHQPGDVAATLLVAATVPTWRRVLVER